MRTAVRRLIKALVIFVFLLALAVFAVIRLADVDAWREDVAAQLSQRMGFDVHIGGALRVELAPRPAVVTGDVVVRQPGAPEAPRVARVDALSLEMDLARSWRERRVVLAQARAAGVDVDLVRDADGRGNWQLVRRVVAPEDRPTAPIPTRLPLERVVLERVRITYETDVSDWAFELDVERLDAEVAGDGRRVALDAQGAVQGRAFRVDLVAEAHGAGTPPILAPGADVDVELSGHLGPLEADVSGRLREPRGDARAELDWTLHLDDVGELRELVRVDERTKLAGLGAVDARAQLVGGAGEVRLEDVVIEVGSPETGRLVGRGRIADLVHGSGIDLALELDTPDLGTAARRLRIPTPGAGAATGTGHLRGTWPQVRFDDIDVDAALARDGMIRVSGDVAREARKWGAALDVIVETQRAGDVATMIEEIVASVDRDAEEPVRLGRPDAPVQQALMAIGPARVEAHLEGHDKSWTLEAIAARAGDAGADTIRAQGRIATLVPRPEGVSLRVDAGSDDFVALSERAGAPVRGLEMLRLHGKIVGSGNALVLSDMQAVATTPDRITLGVTGDLPIGDRWRDIRSVVAVSARDLAVLGEVMDRRLPAVGPLELSARLHAEDESIVGEEMVVHLGETVVTGRMQIDPGSERPFVTARIHSERVRLRDLGVAPDVPAPEAAAEEPGGSWLDSPLPYDQLRAFDGRLGIRVDRLVGRGGLEMADLSLEPRIADGVLEIDDLGLGWQGGRADVVLRVDGGTEPPEVSLDLRGDGFRVERVIAQIVEERLATGVGQVVADLRASGATPRALGASVTGDLLFYGREGGLAMRYSRLLQIDIGPAAARRSSSGALEQVQCLIVDASARKGLLSLETVLLDTEHKQVLGSGRVDLAQEQLDVLLTPVLKQALPGSVGTAVRVHGRLARPKVTPAPLLTASAVAQGLLDRALIPLRRILPGVGIAVDDLRRRADRAIEGTGVDLPDTGLWRPGIDVSCQKVLQTDRIQALRSEGGRTGG